MDSHPTPPPAAVAQAGFVDGDLYERGRQDYDPEAVAHAARALRLTSASTVLDLAAGTGKLTRSLAPFAGAMIAIEPQRQMRAALAKRSPDLELLDGRAEAIPLGSEAVDAVVVGDAFHWFEHQRALAEIARVLAPGGGLAVFVRRPLTEHLEWWRESMAPTEPHRHAQLGPHRPHESEPWRVALEAHPRFEAHRRDAFERPVAMRPADLVAYVASWSFVRGVERRDRDAVLAAVEERLAAVARSQGVPALTVTWRTEVTCARLAGSAPPPQPTRGPRGVRR